MGTYEIKKNNSSKEALIVDGTMKITRYPNFFTQSENDFANKLIKNKIQKDR